MSCLTVARDPIFLLPKGQWTQRWVLLSPHRALKISKGPVFVPLQAQTAS